MRLLRAAIAGRLFFLALVLYISAPALGQRQRERPEPQSFLNQQRQIEEFIRAEREKLGIPTDRVEFDYGGYFSSFVFLFDDGIESSRTFRRFDLRLWSRLALDEGAHEFYTRMRVSFVDFNSGDEYDDEDDVEAPVFERVFYKFDLARAVQAYEGQSLDYNIEIKVGRDFTQFGTGYALSTTLDQVWVRGTWDNWQIVGLVGRTPGSLEDFDLSRNPERTRRWFYGAELRYTGFERHEPFGYVLWQRDQITDNIPTLFQEYDYDSFYAGIGATGELVRNLRYSTEWVFESGHSYGHRRSTEKNRINAWAWDIALEYLFEHRTRPRASVEYMFASGEGDRLGSPTDSVGGVSRGHLDESFIGFGYRDTGLSFAPFLSNIHIWRAGASFFPFEGDANLKELELGTNWFLYYKHHASAAVSDPTANVQSGYLGWEMDYFANWRVSPDLTATARYGLFFPGKAFEDRTTRTYLLMGFTWNF